MNGHFEEGTGTQKGTLLKEGIRTSRKEGLKSDQVLRNEGHPEEGNKSSVCVSRSEKDLRPRVRVPLR